MRREAGFTLIELMAAMTIMTIGLFAIIHMTVISTRGASYARDQDGATQILQAVSEELRVRALQWTEKNEFSDVFPSMALKMATFSPGADLQMSQLMALTDLEGYTISGSVNFADARPINIFGKSPTGGISDFSDINNTGAIYRVFAVAYYSPLRYIGTSLTSPSLNVVRVLLFVVFDSKDHGRQEYNWSAVTQGTDFWMRNVVTGQLILRRNGSLTSG